MATAPNRKARALAFRQPGWVVGAMIAADILTLEICLAFGFGVRFMLDDWIAYNHDVGTVLGLATGLLVLPLVLLLAGIYPGFGLNDVERLRRIVIATVMVFSILIGWDYLVQRGQWSRGVMLTTWCATMLMLPITFSFFRRTLIRLGCWGTPLIVIGTRGEAQRLVLHLKNEPKLGYVPVGFLDFDPALTGTTVAGIPVLDTVDKSEFWARHVKTAAVAMPELEGEQMVELSVKLPFPQVLLLPEYYGLQTSWVSTRDLGGVLGLEVKKNLLLRHNRLLKRAVDLVCASILLVIFFPVLLLASLAIMSVSRSVPFYRHVVVGRNMVPFSMFKLRTMYPDAKERLEQCFRNDPSLRAEWLTNLKLRNDPRVLPFVGSFLRRSSIDELPQLINVIRGEMSLVGPRPFAVYEQDVVDGDYLALRSGVQPGITGLWQVEVRSEGSIEDRQSLDTYYIRNWSLWLDIYILFKTFPSVLTGRGAY